MPHHGNEEEHGSSENRRDAEQQENEPQKPVIHDNRKVDPKTGQARHPDQEHAAAAADSGSGDALSQAEDILNSVEVPAAESVAQGAAALPRRRSSGMTSAACRPSTSTTASGSSATGPWRARWPSSAS